MFCGENNFFAMIQLYPFYNNLLKNVIFSEIARLTWVTPLDICRYRNII